MTNRPDHLELRSLQVHRALCGDGAAAPSWRGPTHRPGLRVVVIAVIASAKLRRLGETAEKQKRLARGASGGGHVVRVGGRAVDFGQVVPAELLRSCLGRAVGRGAAGVRQWTSRPSQCGSTASSDTIRGDEGHLLREAQWTTTRGDQGCLAHTSGAESAAAEVMDAVSRLEVGLDSQRFVGGFIRLLRPGLQVRHRPPLLKS